MSLTPFSPKGVFHRRHGLGPDATEGHELRALGALVVAAAPLVDIRACNWPNTFMARPCIQPVPPSAPVAPSHGDVGPSCVLTRGELAECVIDAWSHAQACAKSQDKARLRALHVNAKRHDDLLDLGSLRRDLRLLGNYFPDPKDIDPERIEPELVPVGGRRSLEGRLFRLCRGTWSMPFSKGYGRRLRFLVFDHHHEAVMGIIGLQSPPADLRCRDEFFGSTQQNRLERANATMDAYTVGASPTYSRLIGGKLVAGFMHSNLVRQQYWLKYGNQKTLLEGKRLKQPLLAVTTTSAFGRSSIYNRLKFDDRLLARPLGYTKGFGTVHLEAIYPHLVAWLKDRNKHVPAGYGNGPKVRWQNISRAMTELRIPGKCLEHGFRREVFIFEFASNLATVLQNGVAPEMQDFADSAWSSYWKERWCLPRAMRDPTWKDIDVAETMRTAIESFA